MPKKQNPPAVSEKIAPTAVEISVAKSGFLKPYMACFSALPDNIAREPLGMLSGIFSIGDRSEPSAYIVNFLVSLAKKEYYGNPRRGSLESFESCLHKVNLGLSELAKEGNTEWIGTLDAALLSVEKHNLHFSVAGGARVYLLRDRRLSLVSEGLAEDGERHPMKTFTDVASGKICAGDRIIATTPELFTVLSEAELERAALRLPEDGFERFLKTASVNELDLSATVLVSIRTVEEYRRPQAPRRALASPGSVPNAWSLASFEHSKRAGTSIKAELEERKLSAEEKERVDDKTGHIYVTGDIPGEESGESWEKFRSFLEGGRSIFVRFFKTLRFELSRLFEFIRKKLSSIGKPKSPEEGADEFSGTVSANSFAAFGNEKERPNENIESEYRAPNPPNVSDPPESDEVSTESPSFFRRLSLPGTIRLIRILPSRINFLRPTVHIPVRDETPHPSRFLRLASAARFFIRDTAEKALALWKRLSPKARLIVVGIIALVAILVVFFGRESDTPVAKEPLAPPSFEAPDSANFPPR